MGYTRFDPPWAENLTRARRWRTGSLNRHSEHYLTAGRTGDGKAYLHHSGKGDAYAFDSDEEAEAMLDRWLGENVWHPIPARFGPDGLPADGRRWRIHGQTWLPDDQIDESSANEFG